MMKKSLFVFSVILTLCGLMAGCGKNVANGNQVFVQAAPELKQAWDQAVNADKTNDYVAAVTGYRSLMKQGNTLTADQVDAVNAAALAINQRMYAAGQNGDEAAKQALQKFSQMQMPVK